MKRLTIIALIVLLIAGLFVACDQDKIVDDEFNQAIDITSETRSLVPGNTYRTVADTTIKDRVTVEGEGTVTILLSEGKTLTAEKGINVTEKQELHIEGTGKLVATGDSKSAGIGGGDGENGGTIVIQGGEITANGGSEGGAGIGGGKGGKGGTTIIQKLDGKDVPEVTTKGGTAGSDGIGNGEGATGDSEDIELVGVGLESSDDELTWYDFDEEPHYRKQYMRTFEGVTISFNANGGTGDMPDQIAHVNKDKKLNANAFTNGEMNFVGWNTKADGTGTAYGNKGTINTDKDVTLFAQWADAIPIDETTTTLEGGNKYTITEDVDNYNRLTITDDGDKTVTIYLPAGTKLTLRKGINVEQGKTLIIEGAGTLDATGDTNCAGIGGDDLVLTRDCGTIIIKGGTVQATGSTYAAGIGGGGGGAGGTVSILGGTVIATGSSTGSTPGIGNGFEASNKGTLTLGTGMSLTGDDTTGDTFITGPVDEDTTYTGERYKVMKVIPSVTVTFDKKDSAASGEMQPQKVTYNVEQNLNENKFTHPTLNFTGWNTKSDGTGTTYADKGKIKITEDTTLYAQWGDAPAENYISKDTMLLTAGLTYTLDPADIDSEGVLTNTNRIYVSGTGTVTINLPAEKTLKLTKGLFASTNQVLVIEGSGTLNAGSEWISVTEAPAIGATDGGKVIIKSGTVVAQGSPSGAGIGGNQGEVEIQGGKVTATGGTNAAGIGGEKTKVTINGGEVIATGSNGAGIGGVDAVIEIDKSGTKVTAEGGDNAAGIGGSNCTVTIKGGTVIATGKGLGAGIGSDGSNAPNKITISGGNITANGGSSTSPVAAGAGIGGGSSHLGGIIEITGGTITKAQGGSRAAGIGGGYNAPCGNITISGGTIALAQGGSGSAGIGGGDGEYAAGGDITISGGTITKAQGGQNGAGIGGGKGKSGGTILISGGTITLASGGTNGAGIGGGNGLDGTGGNITITGGTITKAQGGSGAAGIGGGYPAAGGTIEISGDSTNIIAKGGDGGAGIGGGSNGNGGSVTISGGTIEATGGVSNGGYGGAAGIGAGIAGDGDTVIISGGTVTAFGGDKGSYGAAGIGGGTGYDDKGGDGGSISLTGGIVKATGGTAAHGLGKGSYYNYGAPYPVDGTLSIGEGLDFYGGDDEDHSAYITSGPIADYGGTRYAYMETNVPTQVTVTFNNNGGSGSMDAQSVVSGRYTQLSGNTFTRDGYALIGWATSSTGAKVYNDGDYILTDENTTLFAKWVEATVMTSSTTTLNGGTTYLVNSNITIPTRISVSGNALVTLVIAKNCTLEVRDSSQSPTHGGINVSEGQNLTITGMGQLLVRGDEYCAGIGGGHNQDAGSITIEGGIYIFANGGSNGGAGIGGGRHDNLATGDGGTITINGGRIDARGNNMGAGIGGGGYGKSGTIVINSGTIERAWGGESAAGIGGGSDGAVVSITIGNDLGKPAPVVTEAWGAGSGAQEANRPQGIGRGGKAYNPSLPSEGTITLLGGVTLEVSPSGNPGTWSSYTGTRKQWMRTTP